MRVGAKSEDLSAKGKRQGAGRRAQGAQRKAQGACCCRLLSIYEYMIVMKGKELKKSRKLKVES